MAYFKELIQCARSTGELRDGDAEYVLGLWEASDDQHASTQAHERWHWWQENAEGIAQDRAVIWRALRDLNARVHSGYDFNADPDGITLQVGEALKRVPQG